MKPELELARESDCIAVFDAMLRMLHKSPAKQMALVEPEHAYTALVQAVREQRLYLYGDYAILVDVGSPWHTTKLVLFEEIIIRYQRVYGHDVSEAVAQLDSIARQHGCVAVAAGDTQVGLMAPRYLAAGFEPLGTQFYKEIP